MFDRVDIAIKHNILQGFIYLEMLILNFYHNHAKIHYRAGTETSNLVNLSKIFVKSKVKLP